MAPVLEHSYGGGESPTATAPAFRGDDEYAAALARLLAEAGRAQPAWAHRTDAVDGREVATRPET